MLSDDLVITPALLRRFHAEAELEGGDGRHYAVIRSNDGSLLVHDPGSPSISGEQWIWTADLLELLNRELHHDGAWVVVFTHPLPDYRRYVLLWLDRDGDVQFALEWVAGENSGFRDFVDVLLAGVHSTAQKCQVAWEIWHTMMIEVIEPREGQTFKRARGERASSTRH
jgi:hypothetical protein